MWSTRQYTHWYIVLGVDGSWYIEWIYPEQTRHPVYTIRQIAQDIKLWDSARRADPAAVFEIATLS